MRKTIMVLGFLLAAVLVTSPASAQTSAFYQWTVRTPQIGGAFYSCNQVNTDTHVVTTGDALVPCFRVAFELEDIWQMPAHLEVTTGAYDDLTSTWDDYYFDSTTRVCGLSHIEGATYAVWRVY